MLKENTFIGELGMRVSSPKYNKGEIHYSLIPAFWNKGYATEAVQAILRHGFETLNLYRIEAGVATQNLKSIKLLEKVGMTREGIHQKFCRFADNGLTILAMLFWWKIKLSLSF